ncbi:MAG: hypothetical protein LC808_21045, partial [Actinobacteria bacterium]|nr:hypothetical protein [Actinomycetota bacterium]
SWQDGEQAMCTAVAQAPGDRVEASIGMVRRAVRGPAWCPAAYAAAGGVELRGRAAAAAVRCDRAAAFGRVRCCGDDDAAIVSRLNQPTKPVYLGAPCAITIDRPGTAAYDSGTQSSSVVSPYWWRCSLRRRW